MFSGHFALSLSQSAKPFEEDERESSETTTYIIRFPDCDTSSIHHCYDGIDYRFELSVETRQGLNKMWKKIANNFVRSTLMSLLFL